MINTINNLQEISKNQRVLFVEDQFDSRESLMYVLERIFGDIISCTDGLEAFNTYFAFERDYFDIVITDLCLPNLNGIELVKKIKEANPNQLIVIVSAYADSLNFLEALNLGIEHYILKPIDVDTFFDVLYKVAQKANHFRENIEYKAVLETKVTLQQKEIDNLIFYDKITNQPNLNMLQKELKTNTKPLVLMLIRIDNLSNIKEHLGKDFSDEYLKEIVSVLNLMIRGSDFCLGLYVCDFDQIAILFKNNIDRMKPMLDELIDFSNHFIVTKEDINLTSPFTIAVDLSIDELYEKTLNLLIRAVDECSGSYLISGDDDFDESKKHKENLYWLKTFSESLEDNSLVPFFQPILNNKTKKIEKYEALARIVHSDKIVTPQYFLHLASKFNQTQFLAKNMIRKTFEKFKDHKEYALSINLSILDLKHYNILKFIRYWQEKFEIEPQKITFELTETDELYESNILNQILKELQESKFKIAIDDFGTGYSNFVYLNKLEVDYIKIDGSFIKTLDKDSRMVKIVKNIDSLIKMYNAKSIAEYVHNKEIFDIVCDIGCDYSQGYFIGEPKDELI